VGAEHQVHADIPGASTSAAGRARARRGS
jgi:hypothetical protein